MTTTNFSSRLHLLSDHLVRHGFWIQDSLFDSQVLQELNSTFNDHLNDFKPASIGHKSSKTVNESLRSDSICWVDESNTQLQSYCLMIQAVTNRLKSELYLPIRRTETQIALYKEGQFYSRHKDRHFNSSQRLVTSVFYLNDNWKAGDGGELIIYPSNTNLNITQQVVEPISNRLVVFLSELEHEVLETYQTRKSFTTWFREDI
jgi:SM-20-related protein